MGTQDKLIIWHPFKPTFFKVWLAYYLFRKGVENAVRKKKEKREKEDSLSFSSLVMKNQPKNKLKKKKKKEHMKANFICPLNWTTECPDVWSNINLSVSVRVISDEINVYNSRLSKGVWPPPPTLDRPHPIQDRAEQRKKGWPSLSKREFFLPRAL